MLELLARRAGQSEPGFAEKRARWGIVFDSGGAYLDVVELGDVGQRGNKGQSFPCCPEFDRTFKQSGGKAEFLIDSAGVVALNAEPGKPLDAKLPQKHAHFVELLSGAAAVVPGLKSVARALADEAVLARVRQRFAALKAKSTDKVTLQIGPAFPLESTAWHDWWRKEYARSCAPKARPGAKTGKGRMVCFVTGDVVEPLDTHPKIEGLAGVGGQGMGDVLVGMDKEAFQSYFLEQSANAAVGKQAAYGYRAALNELIRQSSRKLAGALVVHWFKEKVDEGDDPLGWLEEPPEGVERNAQQFARELLESIAAGRRPDLAQNHYYALTLSGMSGRVMVRDWMEGDFRELVESILSWFSDLAVVDICLGTEGRPLGMGRIIEGLLPSRKSGQEYSDWIKALGADRLALWRAATKRESIPHSALARAVLQLRGFVLTGKIDEVLARDRRNFKRKEQLAELLRTRMGLMKAYHIRQCRLDNKEAHLTPYLNKEHPSPAYQCGRLMAILARLQQAALGDVGAGVVQRYYAAASTTPALVLGRLVRGAQFHLGKLDPGLAYWYEQQLGEVVGRIGSAAPKTLTLEEQSLFALGYYQQLAEMRVKKSAEDKEA